MMPRYIDAEKLEQRLRDFSDWCRDNRKDGADFVLNGMLADTPTADVQEVLRCKDCKYLYQDGNIKVCKHWNCHSTTDDAYCSYGERRKEYAKIH